MRKLGHIITAILLAGLGAHAQQRPQYTQYIFNNYLLNPALSGIENYTDIKMGYRRQWTGIENAPQTSFVAAHWKLGDDYLWGNPLSLPDKGDDPMSRNYMQNYTASPAHHGIGVVAVYDKAAAISRLDFNLTYAYHLQLQNALNLSVGVSAGFSRIGFDANSLQFEDQTREDPAIRNTTISQFKPDLGMGLWLYGARFFAGVSLQSALPQKLSFTKNTDYNSGKEVPHLFVTSGYRFFLDEEISLTPSVMFKQVTATLSADLNMKASYKDKFWIGGSYRKGDSFSAMMGGNFGKMLNLTYAYDFTTSGLNKVSNGSHEIVLGIQLNNVYQVWSGQRRMW